MLANVLTPRSRTCMQVADPGDWRNVRVVCLWDNERLHGDMRKPMYKCWVQRGERILVLVSAEQRP